MIRVIEEVVIGTSVEAVWNFLTHLEKDDRYKLWHPKDHIKLSVIKGSMETEGSIFYFEEYLGGKKLRLLCSIIKIKKGEYILYEAAFPLSLLRLGKGAFSVKKITNRTTLLRMDVSYGYTIPFFAKIIDTCMEAFALKQKDLQKHTQEEFLILRKHLEKEII